MSARRWVGAVALLIVPAAYAAPAPLGSVRVAASASGRRPISNQPVAAARPTASETWLEMYLRTPGAARVTGAVTRTRHHDFERLTPSLLVIRERSTERVLGRLTVTSTGVELERLVRSRSWSVPLRSFPSSPVPAPGREELPYNTALRALAIAPDGTILVGGRDGALVGLDEAGTPRFQLGLRGAVDKIELTKEGNFEVTTAAGVAVVTPSGSVVSDTSLDAVIGEVRRTPLSGSPKFVSAVVEAAPDDLRVLTYLVGKHPGRLHRWSQGRWQDFGLATPPRPGLPFTLSQPPRLGPGGNLLILGTLTAKEAEFPPKKLEVSLREWATPPAGAGAPQLRDRADLAQAIAGGPDLLSYVTRPGAFPMFAASPGGREVYCYGTRCFGKGFSGPWESDAATPTKGTPWTTWEWPAPKGERIPPRALHFVGETLWAAENTPAGGQLLRAGKVLFETRTSGPGGNLGFVTTHGDKELLAIASGLASCRVIHWDGGRFGSLTCPGQRVESLVGHWGDLWLVVDGRLLHHDGRQWLATLGTATGRLLTATTAGEAIAEGRQGLERLALQAVPAPMVGTKAPAPPLVLNSTSLKVSGAASGYRLEQVELGLGKEPSLSRALDVARGPDGVIWFHDGTRIVALEGSKATVVQTESKPPLHPCHHCLAPMAAGKGVTPLGALRMVGGAPPTPPLPLSDLTGMVRSPTNTYWVTRGGAQDWLGHIAILDNGGWRSVLGAPLASYAALAIPKDDDAWFAGGMSSGQAGTPQWPSGEGILTHFDGKAFSRFRGPDGAFLAVASTGPGSAVAAGFGGGLLAVTGTKATAYSIRDRRGGNSTVLRAVAATGRDGVWLAGDSSLLLLWDGSALKAVDPGPAGLDAAFTALIPPQKGRESSGWVVGPAGIWRIVPNK